MLIDSRERGMEGEKEMDRNIDVKEKCQLVASYTHPNWAPKLQPKHVL